MRGSEDVDELFGNRQVVLVLRLVLDQQAHLHHGELLDAEATRQGGFVTLTGLTEMVAQWLARQQDATSAEPVRHHLER